MESPMLDNKNVEVTINTSTSSSSNQFIPDNLELPDDTFRMSLDNFSMIGENVTIGRGVSVDSSVAGNAYTPSIDLPSPLQTPDLQTPDIEIPDSPKSHIGTLGLQTPDIETPDLQTPYIETVDGQTPGIGMPDVETPGAETIDLQTPGIETQVQNPIIEKPDNKTGAETIDLQTPDIETLNAQTPSINTPDIETPDTETIDLQTPDIETLNAQTPSIDTPDIETPDTETIDLQTPDIETLDVQTPGIETPDVETPDTETIELQTPDIETPANETPYIETPDVQTPPPEEKTSPPIIETPKQSETKTEMRRPQTLLKLSLTKKSDNDLFVKPSPVTDLMSPARMLQFEVEATSATPTMKRAAVDFDFFSKNNFEEYFDESELKEDKKTEDPGDGAYKETAVIVKADTVRLEIGYGFRLAAVDSDGISK